MRYQWVVENKNPDVYFHTKNVLGFKVAFSVQGLSIIAAPVLCGWDLLCGDMKGTKYAWGKDCETQWGKEGASALFQFFSFVLCHHLWSYLSFQVKSVGCIHGWNYLHKWTLTALCGINKDCLGESQQLKSSLTLEDLLSNVGTMLQSGFELISKLE